MGGYESCFVFANWLVGAFDLLRYLHIFAMNHLFKALRSC